MALGTVLLGLLATPSPAQTIITNDNFADRIILTGSEPSIELSFATLTREAGEPDSYPIGLGSVWWEWTAPASGNVVITEVGDDLSAADLGNSWRDYADGPACIRVFEGNSLTNLMVVAQLNRSRYPDMAVFRAEQGGKYQIALCVQGSYAAYDWLGYGARLSYTNAVPVFQVQPLSQTVEPFASVHFYAWAEPLQGKGLGSSTVRYEWLLWGRVVTNVTGPILSLPEVTPRFLTEYGLPVQVRAIQTFQQGGDRLTNSSIVATLSKQLPGPHLGGERPVLGLVKDDASSGNFTLRVDGPAGAPFTLQSSSDLLNWQIETNFRGAYFYTDRVIANGSIAVQLEQGSGRRFFRTKQKADVSDTAKVCQNELRQIQVAKAMLEKVHWWLAAGHGYSIGDLFGSEQFIPAELRCPLNDVPYNTEAIGVLPTCNNRLTYPDHTLSPGVLPVF